MVNPRRDRAAENGSSASVDAKRFASDDSAAAQRPLLVYVINSFDRGGAESGLLELVSGGLFARFRVVIVALVRGSGGFERRLTELGFPPEILIDRARMRARDLPILLVRLRRLIGKVRPSVVVASLPQANLLARIGVLLDKSVVFVSFEHNTQLAKRAYEIGYRLTSWRVDWSFADALSTMRVAWQRLYRRKPANEAVVPLVSFGTAANRSYTGTSKRTFRVVNAGRLTAVKNQGALIEAVALLRRSNIEVALTLYGDGPERDVYEALARRLGVAAQVRFAGYVEGWVRDGADLFVLASRHEGLCLVVLEAMHAGIPVAAPIIGGLQDYATPALVRELATVDAQSIANVIADAVADPASSEPFVRRAAAMIDERYSIRAVHETYRAVNQALLTDALASRDAERPMAVDRRACAGAASREAQ